MQKKNSTPKGSGSKEDKDSFPIDNKKPLTKVQVVEPNEYIQNKDWFTPRMIIEYAKIFIAISGLLITIFGVIRPVAVKIIANTETTGKAVNEVKENVQTYITGEKFQILSPKNSSIVSQRVIVQGEIPWTNFKVYVIVTPVDVGGNLVQPSITVNPDGTWSGPIMVGTAALGVGKEFLIRAIATDVDLKEGSLIETPSDAKFSNTISVTRK